jgi:hypothetical protein
MKTVFTRNIASINAPIAQPRVRIRTQFVHLASPDANQGTGLIEKILQELPRFTTKTKAKRRR